MTTLLDVRDVSVAYGKVEAIHRVSLKVDEGSIVTVIGPNGAGKTTLLGAIMGTLPAEGDIAYRGERINAMSVEHRVGAGMVLVPEKRELFGSMKVADNLELGAFARLRQGDRDALRTLDDVYVRFPRLRERQGQEAGTLSGGERQMLALGRALMAKPKLLMLDEPSLGLAPLIVKELFGILARLNKEEGLAVLLVEQNANLAMEIADRAYLLETGRIVASGDAEAMRNDDAIRQAYLGY
jgi:branched-chain amino acid transport system ATP-binding protein